MEDFLKLNKDSPEKGALPTTTTISTSNGLSLGITTLTTTTCGSNGRPLVTRCYRNNNCSSNDESLGKPKNLNEVSLVNTTIHTKSCSNDKLLVSKSYPKTCSSEISEGATGISDCATKLSDKAIGISENGKNNSEENYSSCKGSLLPPKPTENGHVTMETASKGEKEITPCSSSIHYSYLSVSLVNSSPRTPLLEGETSTRQENPLHISPRSRNLEENYSTNYPQRRISQSRPSSPPPATYFPPPRRPSLSLPPSPQSARIHRVSLPSNPFMSLSLPSARSVPSSTHSSPSTSRPRSPTPPPINRRSPRRRSARTPSPRPPLPPQATNEPNVVPQQPPPPPPNRSRQQECQPYKMRMRSR